MQRRDFLKGVSAAVCASLVTPAVAQLSYETHPLIQKAPIRAWEEAPFVYDGDLYKAGFRRGWIDTIGGSTVIIEKYIPEKDVFYKVAAIEWPRGLGCVHVENGVIHVFGSSSWTQKENAIYRRVLDPLTWDWAGPEQLAYQAPPGVSFFNSSVTKGPDRFVMVYETDEGTWPFSMRFLESQDLVTWTPIGDLIHPNQYSACPTIRYAKDGYYLVSYLWYNQGHFETAIARTSDFITVQTFGGNAQWTPYQQLMSADPLEGFNNSDVDWIEWNGKLFFVYLTGDQQTWAHQNHAWFDGTMVDFYNVYWP